MKVQPEGDVKVVRAGAKASMPCHLAFVKMAILVNLHLQLGATWQTLAAQGSRSHEDHKGDVKGHHVEARDQIRDFAEKES